MLSHVEDPRANAVTLKYSNGSSESYTVEDLIDVTIKIELGVGESVSLEFEVNLLKTLDTTSVAEIVNKALIITDNPKNPPLEPEANIPTKITDVINQLIQIRQYNLKNQRNQKKLR